MLAGSMAHWPLCSLHYELLMDFEMLCQSVNNNMAQFQYHRRAITSTDTFFLISLIYIKHEREEEGQKNSINIHEFFIQIRIRQFQKK